MLTIYDEFAGVGGSSKGATTVPGTELIFAANHQPDAVADHARNFPAADHFEGDVARADIATFPRADIFWASPACPPWSDARGKRRDFDHSTQAALFWEDEPDPETRRARALMEEVPRYLNAMILRGKPVLCGVVENVPQCRQWDHWNRWLREVSCGGLYTTRVFAINSMHARAPRSRPAAQSRNRLYVVYWHRSLGRDPDWNKWLRPKAYCTSCEAWVKAMQVFKKPGIDMGTYGRHGQYWYRCPNRACRHAIVEPPVEPAASIIDASVPVPRIADRARPLVPATMTRILRGVAKFATPTNAGVEIPPFQISLRGGGSKHSARLLDEPAGTVTASGTHHGLVTGQRLLIPYYGNGHARRVEAPLGTVTTRDRWALTEVHDAIDPGDIRFRMLKAHELGAAMAFPDTYIVTGTHTDKVRKYGNAVTPPVAEILISSLVEAITGDSLELAT